ncbi:integrase [Vibrio sp. 1F279]|uniref:integrase n=1 Tax=unclassified Vibrio TaxID=2614977 RepID=UPI00352BEFDB
MSLKLIDNIVDGSRVLSELTKEELIELQNTSIVSGDFRALKVVSNNVTGIYNYNDRKPYWLLDEFEAPTWNLKFIDDKKIITKTIEWEAVTLDDGLQLTNLRHAPLLNSFKYWITASDNPLENGGKFCKGRTIYNTINKIITFMNALLIHGKSIALSKRHLSGLSEDFIMDLLVRLAGGHVINGVYDYKNKVKSLLSQRMQFIDISEAEKFASENPYITRQLLEEEKQLGFSIEERIKACFWLSTIGFYKRPTSTGKSNVKPLGNSNILSQHIYKGKIIPFVFIAPRFEELKLVEKNQKTEFRAIPNVETGEGISPKGLGSFISALKLLNVVHGKMGASQFLPSVMKNITTKRIAEHGVKVKKLGRFKTLPPQLVLDLIRDCYEFTKENQDAILDSMLSVLKDARTKSSAPHSNESYVDYRSKYYNGSVPSTERGAWEQTEALNLIDSKLLKMGVKSLRIDSNDAKLFEKRRKNEGLFDLYAVLIGSIQTLTGAIMARRQDELSSLKSFGNLSPHIDPASQPGKKTDYHLVFNLKKSGIGGEHSQNETIKRPIPRSLALIIWKLEQFNKAATKSKITKNEIDLFSNLDFNMLKLGKSSQVYYNNHLKAACDYFETPTVIYDGGEHRRHYIRQHQLRRFFAMLFFWSRGFDGLDSLRWMLGHTDIEHLYHYITESESGAVLNGVKASYILSAIEEKKIENIQELADILAKRYGVQKENISLSTLTDTLSDYEDVDIYKTTPHIAQVKQRENLESQILELLANDVIKLEPEFFTVMRDGEKLNDFSLTLQVNELV